MFEETFQRRDSCGGSVSPGPVPAPECWKQEAASDEAVVVEPAAEVGGGFVRRRA